MNRSIKYQILVTGFFLIFILPIHQLSCQIISKIDNFIDVESNQLNSLKEINFDIAQAKFNKDTTSLIINYEKRYFNDKSLTSIYNLDSIISLSQHFKSIDYPYRAYILKSIFHFNNYNYQSSIDEALVAYSLAKRNNELEQQFLSLSIIGSINILWDNVLSGLSIYEKMESMLPYFKHQPETTFKLLVFLGKSTALIKLNESEKAQNYIQKGLQSLNEIYSEDFYVDFKLNEALVLNQLDDKPKAIKILDTIQHLNATPYQLSLIKYYAAVYTSEINDQIQLESFKEVQQLFEKNKIITPETIELYSYINSYYLDLKDQNNQLFYLNKLLESIGVNSQIKTYVAKKTTSFYEIPQIIALNQELKNEIIEREEKFKNRILFTMGVILFLTFLIFYYRHKQSRYKKRFNELLQQNPIQLNKEDIQSQSMSVDIVSELLAKLDDFENKKEYLINGITLVDIAKQFGTNSTYLSKVINLKKDKNFSNYINDLRISYCLEILKLNRKMRNYTIKALAEEMGFNNVQSFSNAFYKSTGIYPSYYITQLNKVENSGK